MTGDLVITNGDLAGEAMVKAKVAKVVVPWRDILHAGPLPMTPDLPSLSAERIRFLDARGWSGGMDLAKLFAVRDERLARHADHDRVVLWFENDVYDQLQLLQILDFLGRAGRREGSVLLVQSTKPIAKLWTSQIAALAPTAAPVRLTQMELAAKAWTALRQPTPAAWSALLEEDTSALPHLKAAVERLLEELPATGTGLTRTEAQILKLIADRVRKPRKLFTANNETEAAGFHGDWSFYAVLDRMASGPVPLVEGLNSGPFRPSKTSKDPYFGSDLRLTPAAEQIHSGGGDNARLNPIDRWWGGTRLRAGNLWRWDGIARRLAGPE
jgi:hypothetical protein